MDTNYTLSGFVILLQNHVQSSSFTSTVILTSEKPLLYENNYFYSFLQDVKSKEIEKNTQSVINSTTEDNDETKKAKVLYGQTHHSVSLYEMFRTFKLNSLEMKKPKSK